MTHGEAISAQAARHCACDARNIPMILNANAIPLDVGRATRSWPEHLRRAVIARDRGCTFPGCHRPPA